MTGSAHHIPLDADFPEDDLAGAIPAEEIKGLFEAVFRQYGHDFRAYSPGYLGRRLQRVLIDEKVGTVAELRGRVLGDAAAMERLVRMLTIHTTAFFRDPSFFALIQSQILPVLRTYPLIRIWAAGCSTGEEAYSLAILLHEEGLSSRCRIYATDCSNAALAKAREGIFPLPLMQEYAVNHREAAGRGKLSDYYTDDGRNAILHGFLREGIVFAQHNLVSDESFNEFHLVLCRNVLIYFDRDLQERAHDLIWRSLVRHGFLGLGSSESLTLSAHHDHFQEFAKKERIYRKTTP